MSLRGVTSVLEISGSPRIVLVKDGKQLETLPILSADVDHRSFILSTWVKSYRAQARKQGYGQFYDKHEPEVAESRWEDCYVVSDDSDFTVHAWACGTRDGRLYHCYVVPELRRLRMATRLIEFVCGELKEYARLWPYSAHARVNPYMIGKK